MKTYKFVVTVTEGYDEFWEQLYGKSGCDEVTQLIRDAIFEYIPEATVKLVEYHDSAKE